MLANLKRPLGALLICLTAATSYAGSGAVVLGPANNIQAAINSGLYEEIILGPGTYNQVISVSSPQLPLTIRSQDPTNAGVVASTVVDGLFLGLPVVNIATGVGNTLVIDGLTIQNAAPLAGNGGGIRCDNASPIIRRCTIQNSNSPAGGGFYCNGGAPKIEDCAFVGNTSPYGAAIYGNNSNLSIVRSKFESNVASNEGGACRFVTGTYVVQDCSFVGNTSINFGGAIANRSPSTLQLSRSTFKSNHSGDTGSNGRGGAIYHNGATASFVESCVFDSNSCRVYGGGMYVTTGITVRNCTANGNSAGTGAGFASIGNGVTIVNTIAWNSTPITGAVNIGTTSTVTYSNIQGGFAGAGNIGAQGSDAPLFVNASAGDLRLLPTSPGIDAGSSAVLIGEYPTDCDGNPRAVNDPSVPDTGIAVLGINVDMGAFEFMPSAPPTTCQGDVNGDSLVNGSDLSVLLARFGLACP